MQTDSSKVSVRKVVSSVLGAAILFFGVPAASASAAGVNDYPYQGRPNLIDPWGFYTGYCTSFAAFRLSQAGIRFHGASLQGPNGKTAFFGNGGTWDAAARAIGLAVDANPTVGSVAVWHGGEGGAWPGGHVGYVIGVDAAGNVRVEEYNYSYYLRYDQRTTRAPRYIHFAPTVAASPVAYVVPKPAPAAGHPFHTTSVLRERSGPGTSYPTVRFLKAWQQVTVVCQVRSGSLVSGTSIWDRLSDGTYVTDYYLSTPAFNAFSPGLPHC